MKHANSLDRFVEAQQTVYETAVDELRQGREDPRWMWFIFPQLRGLGTSEDACTYGLASPDEAAAYLEHPILGPRLRECIAVLLDSATNSVNTTFGRRDEIRLLSCLTIFGNAVPDDRLFQVALLRLFGGTRDSRTFELLGHEE